MSSRLVILNVVKPTYNSFKGSVPKIHYKPESVMRGNLPLK